VGPAAAAAAVFTLGGVLLLDPSASLQREMLPQILFMNCEIHLTESTANQSESKATLFEMELIRN